MSHGALEFRAPEKRYFTTERGRAFVRAFDHYRETVNLLGKQEAALAEFFPTTAKRTLVDR
jgi:hypothetical protein